MPRWEDSLAPVRLRIFPAQSPLPGTGSSTPSPLDNSGIVLFAFVSVIVGSTAGPVWPWDPMPWQRSPWSNRRVRRPPFGLG